MKKILFGLTCLFIASQLMVSCSSESSVMSQFSKRKYLKNFKEKKVIYKDNINNYVVAADELASIDANPTDYQLKEIEAVDHSKMVEFTEEQAESTVKIKEPTTDYRDWNKYNRQVDLSAVNFNQPEANRALQNVKNSSQVNEVVLAILCIFIPPLAVYLYEDSITTNFWVDLILILLFWFPSVIFAFLVCFGGVSL